MKKFMSILLTFLLICSISIPSFAAEESVDAHRMQNEVEATEQYQKLLSNLAVESGISMLNAEDEIASDYYGGSYIDSDGELVVCVTNQYDMDSGLIQAYTENDNISIINVDYTYNDLIQEQDRITKLYDTVKGNSENTASVASASSELETIFSSLSATYTDEENNVLVVQLKEINADKINAFQELVSDADFIVFEDGDNNTTTATAWNPGRKIYSSSSSFLSTGYPVYFTNSDGDRVRGFITAGHAFSEGDIVYRTSSGKLGVCVDSALSGSVDAALIEITNSSYEISSNTYYDGVALSKSFTFPSQGATIYKEGATSGTTSGTVSSTSCTVYYDNEGVSLSRMIKTTALNLAGDSGGVAYTSSGSIVGSMSGSSYSGSSLTEDTFECSYICRGAYALTAFTEYDCSISS